MAARVSGAALPVELEEEALPDRVPLAVAVAEE